LYAAVAAIGGEEQIELRRDLGEFRRGPAEAGRGGGFLAVRKRGCDGGLGFGDALAAAGADAQVARDIAHATRPVVYRGADLTV